MTKLGVDLGVEFIRSMLKASLPLTTLDLPHGMQRVKALAKGAHCKNNLTKMPRVPLLLHPSLDAFGVLELESKSESSTLTSKTHHESWKSDRYLALTGTQLNFAQHLW